MRNSLIILAALAAASASSCFSQTDPSPATVAPADFVAGNLIQFNDNGNWTWYSDERSIVDQAKGKIIVGSDGNGSGMGGSARSGAIESAVFDLQNGTSKRYTMLANGILGPDDHNTPALMLRPDGKYLAQWTGHNQNYLSYFSVFDGTNWSPYATFDWHAIGATSSEMASYSNPHYLPAEDKTYTFVRSLDIKCNNILVSTNHGDTWTYYGKVNRSYPGSGYNPGYYRFADNGKDRIDFICTESHPRDTLTSIYHGYISNSMSFKSDGTVVDTNLNDTIAPLSSDFQLVFSNGTVMPTRMTNYRCWNDDVQLYAEPDQLNASSVRASTSRPTPAATLTRRILIMRSFSAAGTARTGFQPISARPVTNCIPPRQTMSAWVV